MGEVIRKLLEIWIVRHTPPIELRRAKLESLAREFTASVPGEIAEKKIKEAFRLGGIWLSELEKLEGDS